MFFYVIILFLFFRMADVAKPSPKEDLSKPKETKKDDSKVKPAEDDLSDEDKLLQVLFMV